VLKIVFKLLNFGCGILQKMPHGFGKEKIMLQFHKEIILPDDKIFLTMKSVKEYILKSFLSSVKVLSLISNTQ